MGFKYTSIHTLFEEANKSGKKVSDFIIDEQAESMNVKREDVYKKMKEVYNAMRESIEVGLKKKSKLKIEQEGQAENYDKHIKSGKSMLGDKMGIVVARALAVSEVNAGMGRIVASPTAGSCGILPASILSIQDIYNISEEKTIDALFIASAVGMVIANVSSIAGATGGCQAECGAAQCMAAASIVDMLGGTYEMMEDAMAIAFSNIEGLVCDPVAGLVECPCIKRNASGALNAVLAADMALAGIKSIIPVDEVLLAVKQVGDIMDDRLKETASGGLATTPTGKALKKKVFS